MIRQVAGVACGLWLVTSAACGDSDARAPDAGGQDAAIEAGSGGAGTGGGVGTGGSGGAATVTCGGVECQSLQATDAFALPACCTAPGTGQMGHALELLGRAPNQCGLFIGVSMGTPLCAQVDQPGASDPTCPSFVGASGPMAGCCTDEGYCGVMETVLSLGCTYNPNTGRGAACGRGMDAGLDEDAGR